MDAAEKRIREIESKADKGQNPADYAEAMVAIFCEIARQLTRLAALYEFELGLGDNPQKAALYDAAKAARTAGPQFSKEFLDGRDG